MKDIDYRKKTISILLDKKLEMREKFVLLYILYSPLEEAPSRKKISYDLGINNTTLGKCLKGLESKNYLTVSHNRQKGLFSTNSYALAKGYYNVCQN